MHIYTCKLRAWLDMNVFFNHSTSDSFERGPLTETEVHCFSWVFFKVKYNLMLLILQFLWMLGVWTKFFMFTNTFSNWTIMADSLNICLFVYVLDSDLLYSPNWHGVYYVGHIIVISALKGQEKAWIYIKIVSVKIIFS